MKISRAYWAAAILFLALTALLNVPNLFGQSPTVDEYAHVPAGYSYLVKKDFRMYSKNPPLIKMISAMPVTLLRPAFPKTEFYYAKGAWGPYYFADAFNGMNKKISNRIYAFARVPVILLGFALGLLVFHWAGSVYGQRAGLMAMIFTASSPTILAHAGLATVDVGFTFFFTLALYCGMRVTEYGTVDRIIVAGLALGAAIISKFSGLFLIPMWFAIAFIIALYALTSKFEGELIKPNRTVRGILFGETIILVAVLAIAFFTIHFGYFFSDRYFKLPPTTRASPLFTKVATGPLGHFPVMLPKDFVDGLDLQMADIQKGEFPNYLNGQWDRKGKWYYFIEAILLKETIPSLLFIIFGIGVSVYYSIVGRQTLAKNARAPVWPFVHLPAILFLVSISFSGNLQLGVRYAMPALPLLYIAASKMLFRQEVPLVIQKHKDTKLGVVVDVSSDYGKKSRTVFFAIVVALSAWHFAEVVRYAPHYLEYFNELAGGPKNGHRYLIDSNIDWGQGLPALSDKMKELKIDEIGLLYFGHADPSNYGIKWHLPKTGDKYIAVSVNFLHGYPYAITYGAPWKDVPPRISPGDLELARSLAEKEPVARAGWSIYIYNVGGPVEVQ